MLKLLLENIATFLVKSAEIRISNLFLPNHHIKQILKTSEKGKTK